MKYNKLGASGLIVSRLGIGTATFGTGTVAPGFVGRMDQPQADRIVSKSLDAGITVFDSADAYSGGESERVLGKALGTRRKEAVITTKVRARVGSGVLDTGLSYRQIKLAVEGSLKRLGTDWIDIYQPHLPDPVTPLEETVRALEQLVLEGKVRYIGLSNYPAWQAARFLGIQERLGFRPLVCAQMYYSLLERELENECVPFYREAGIGVQVWSPLASGFLSGKYTRSNPRPDKGRRNAFPMPPVPDLERAYGIVDQLRRIADARGASPAQVAIAWILRRDWVTTVLVGAADEAQLDENLGALADQCYNAQAVVATGSLLIVAAEVTQAANDKEQLKPMIEKVQALPKALGRTRRILADSGYLSQGNVEQCAAAKIEPLIAMGRSRHHVSWKQRFAAAPKAPPKSATALEKMAYRLKTPRGRKLYGLRKQTPEPVFGIIKSVMGYRQCLLRGLENVKGEWNLVTLSWNIKRMFAMQPC